MGHQPLMEPTLQEQKRTVMQEGINALIEKSSIPRRIHLAAVKALEDTLKEYRNDLTESRNGHKQSAEEIAQHAQNISDALGQVEEVVSALIQEVERLTTIDHLKGEKGDPAEPVDVDEVIEGLKMYIPDPIPGEKGNPGNDAELDMDELATNLIEKIKKEKVLDVSDIKNTNQFFTKDGIKYKFEELMRGAGGTGANSENALTEIVTGLQSGDNVTIDLNQLSNVYSYLLFVTKNGQVLMPNGSAAFPGSSWSQSGSTVTVYNADASSDYFLIQYVPAS